MISRLQCAGAGPGGYFFWDSEVACRADPKVSFDLKKVSRSATHIKCWAQECFLLGYASKQMPDDKACFGGFLVFSFVFTA